MTKWEYEFTKKVKSFDVEKFVNLLEGYFCSDHFDSRYDKEVKIILKEIKDRLNDKRII